MATGPFRSACGPASPPVGEALVASAFDLLAPGQPLRFGGGEFGFQVGAQFGQGAHVHGGEGLWRLGGISA